MGPHALWTGAVYSALKRARVTARLTLAELADRAALSLAAVHAMERSGVGSAAAWSRVATVLGLDVDVIRPVADPRQLTLARQVLVPSGSSA